jgi:ABC-2 type transport system permease protein
LSNEIKNARILVCDKAQDPLSREISRRLVAGKRFDLAIETGKQEDIEEAFLQNRVKLAIVFAPGFQEKLLTQGKTQVQILADASDPNTAVTLTQYAESIIQSVRGKQPMGIEPEVRMVYNPGLKGVTNFVPGVMALVLLLVCVLMTSVSIVREKETGTMEVLLVSPLHPLLAVISKAVPYFVLSLVNLTVILVLGIFVMGMPMHGSYLLLYAVSAILILTALSLGLLISNSTSSQQTAMLISLMAMMLPTVIFTGFMFPIENMPLPLQMISHLVPSKWYYIIIKDIMIKGLGIEAVWKHACILLGMTAFLLFMAIKKFSIRLS